MYKNLEDFIKLELNFCKKKEKETKKLSFTGIYGLHYRPGTYGLYYWHGRIAELNMILSCINK